MATIACSDGELPTAVQEQQLTITSEVVHFDGESVTRVNPAGDNFVPGDLIRLKMVCPFSADAEYGESTWGNSTDAFFLLKWNGGGWGRVGKDFGDHFDITGTYSESNSPDIANFYQAQQTPYVYTAITWTEEKLFIARTGGTAEKPSNSLIDQYSNVFHADQSKLENYLASDLLWAQTYMQTGCWNIHLSFMHKMACLDLLFSGVTLSDKAVVTLENMPDIDQAEVVVGDYYALKSKINSSYGYREKASCSYANHGKVIGVAEVNDQLAHIVVHPFQGGPSTIGGVNDSYQGDVVPNTGTYTAYHSGSTYRIIVPPCKLDNVVVWVRDGEARYRCTLENPKFEEGKLYPMTLSLQ